jgi:exodeoxyribonuclease V alpha subunit
MNTENPIDMLYRRGRLREIDVHFGRFMHDLAEGDRPALALAAALASRATSEGHICLELQRWAGHSAPADSGGPEIPAAPGLEEWEAQLRSTPVVGAPGDYAPLILDARHRLYLYRYWRYESDLAAEIRRRAAAAAPPETVRTAVLRDALRRLFFPSGHPSGTDRHKIAAVVALLKRFCVVTGGPGTGKTTGIAKILALLIEQAAPDRPEILLAAPTGKAAAKLGASLRTAREKLDCSPAVRAAIPEEAQTLHRLLRPIAGGPDFHYDSDNPLPADIVVIDEASMVDLALMAKLIRALAPESRLILLGDKDQLASVAAGAVLGDICAGKATAGFSPEMARCLAQLTGDRLSGDLVGRQAAGPLSDCIVPLKKSYRFAPAGGIDALRRAVNAGDADRVLMLLDESGDGPVALQTPTGPGHLFKLLRQRLATAHRGLPACKDPAQALAMLEGERLLCVVREGPWGVQAVNQWVETRQSVQRRSGADRRWYPGRPILITANDYRLGLYNGDVGITLAENEGDADRLSVFFPAQTGEIRKIPVHRIAEHETAWAMTVHKSQGSEFDHVHLILPDSDTPLLSRPLLYTAVTRARATVTIYGRRRILAAAVGRSIQRSSGLRDALWGTE